MEAPVKASVEKPAAELESLYSNLSVRFKALSIFFGELSTPGKVQELMESMASGDPKVFGKIIGPIEIPDILDIQKCPYFLNLIGTAAGSLKRTYNCFLREDLSQQEKIVYLTILTKHGKPSLANPMMRQVGRQ